MQILDFLLSQNQYTCTSFQLKCDCGEEMVFEAPTRGSKDERHLALAKCTNAKNCKKAPIDKVVKLENMLTLAIRRHLSNYYRGYVSCEDPACTGRSRQLPLEFRGAFPVCHTCQKAIMTKEVSDKQLYLQLLYYQQLFDVAKVSSKFGKNFNVDLVGVKDGQLNYLRLKQHVDQVMNLNNYSIIDMTRLFSGFSAIKASRFRKAKNY